MLLKHFFIPKIAHSSYLVAGKNQCAIVDPSRDITMYIETAQSLGFQITHVLETHLHADFVSGHCELADRIQAKIYAPKAGACEFEHIPVSQGDTIELDDVLFKVIETPGHTPEHVNYVVIDTARGKEPVGVFTGDTLFINDVGRPDLFPGRAQELASKLFDSLHKKILKLPDFCEVYPAHGAGSLCGRTMAAKYRSTIGYERRHNTSLLINDRDKFIRSLTTDMPPAPDHFSRCSAINGQGPELIKNLSGIQEMKPSVFYKAMKEDSTIVLDVRNYDAFGGQHIPGAINIYLQAIFATFAGWILPQDAEVLLVTENPADVQEAAIWLRRVGIDRITGYLKGSMFAWASQGLPTAQVAQVSGSRLHDMVCSKEPIMLVDVRSPGETVQSSIEGAVNIPAPDLRTRFNEIDTSRPAVLFCSSGFRGSMGCSILKQHSIHNVFNVAGGMAGYHAAGYGTACKACKMPHGPRIPEI